MPSRARRGRILAVAIDQKSGQPLYRQIYGHVRQCILDGRLALGARLPYDPPARGRPSGLAQHGRAGVRAAFRAEGYIEGLGGAGTPSEWRAPRLVRASRLARPRAGRAAALISRRVDAGSRDARCVAPVSAALSVIGPRAFRAGVPAVDVFPVDTWGRLMARRWGRTPAAAGVRRSVRVWPLRAAVAEYLRAARGVRCTPEQVLIVGGSQQAIDLCARVLLDPGDRGVDRGSGLPRRASARSSRRAPRSCRCPVDAEGLMVHEGRTRAPDARLAFVTPSRQLPLGVTMSLRAPARAPRRGRRRAALDPRGRLRQRVPLRDRPLAALQGLDQHGLRASTPARSAR